MRYYFAPMEGLTDSAYRRLHHRYFPGLARYYTPFFSPTVHRSLTPKEARELPEAGEFAVVPQLLTKEPADFLWMVGQCAARGYDEVNLNLGCPSGTVTAKGKGAGMLSSPDRLDAFLDAVFSACPVKISVKTRLGVHDPGEFPRILEIFNRYPICELILHPRVRDAFYGGDVDGESVAYAFAHSRAPVCYNGNLCTRGQIDAFAAAHPQAEAVMLGRGLIGDPGMLTPGGTAREALEAFHGELLETYLHLFGGSRNAMFRLKEHWRYWICHFENAEKLGKRLRKTTDIQEYRAITSEIFHTLPFRPALKPDW